ncbi:PP2C family protein-serine/threonine phosphatase [Sphaerisporangium corydalis]|uniref:PP2C family protein-serine/threonine phosphatase n=1 Tax=Sphaerisporangium corydalis TaxID=1441875 RepID=A0ABV9EC43_9ACTN|nr:PP2C family protein-serine/threonine phosphatase [Sphaerisporangium corydalis]
MVGVVGGSPPPLPTPNHREAALPDGPAPLTTAETILRLRARLAHAQRIMWEFRRQLLDARERAAEARHVSLALRDAILPDPGGSIRLPSAHIAVRYVPAEKASSLGGDWYEATALPDGEVLLAIGDVAGHGLPAIAQMAQLRHALVGLAMTGERADRLLAWLNGLVCHRMGEEGTATAVIGHLEPVSGLFTWAQAGHLPPILVRDGVARQLSPPDGVLLGTTLDLPYALSSLSLRPGDLLLLFTDGLVERRGRDIDEGLALTVAAAETLAWDACLESKLDTLVESVGGPNPEDDICLLAVGVLEG